MQRKAPSPQQPLNPRFGLKTYHRWFGVRGIVFFIRSNLLHQTGETVIQNRLVREPLSLRLGSSDLAFYYQIFIRKEYDLPFLKPPAVIIDAGANIGLASVFLANRYPQARIIALEPEASNFKMLTRNTAAYPQITPIQAALWNQNTHLDLYHPAPRPGAFGIFTTRAADESVAGQKIGQTPAVTISKIMMDYGLAYIDFLKVDIEGAEKEVFSNPDPWIHKTGLIMTELHDRYRRGCALSFFTAIQDFEHEWHIGEHVIVARSGLLQADSPKFHPKW